MAPRVKSLCVLMGLFFLGGGLSTLRAEGGASKPLSQIAQEANEAYAKGDLNAAISGYQLLMERDVADPALFYNLGTAYARSGDKGRAVWMFLKARRLDPRNHTIRENLELVAPDADSQIAVFPLLPLELIYGFLSMNGWAAFAACWTVLAAALLLVYFSGRMEGLGRMFLRRTAMVCAIIAAAGHFFAAVKYYEEAYSSRGVVIAADVHPREAPHEDAPAAEFILPPGTVIRVESAGVQGWVKAIYGGRNEVFIRRDQMEFL